MNHIECSDCRGEIDPDTCWCGDAMADHCGFSHNHSPVPMGCNCYRAPREMVLRDIAVCWYVAPSLAEQWAHFNVAFFTREGSRGYYGWSFAS